MTDRTVGSEVARSPGTRRLLKWALISVVALAVLGIGARAILPLIIRKSVIRIVAAIGKPRFSAVLQRAAIASAVRGYALAPDATITPAAAGRAYHHLVWWRNPSGTDFLVPGPDSATSEWYQAEGVDSLGSLPPATWCSDLVSRAAHGLSPAEVVTLRRLTVEQPRDTLFRTFARAPGADILGNRWTYKTPGDDPLFFYKLPIPHSSPFRGAVRIWCGRAALQLHAGHPSEAERILKEALEGSILLMDEAPTTPEMVMGIFLTKTVALALTALYDVTDRGAEAASLRRAMESAVPAPLPGRLGDKDVTMWDIMDALPLLFTRSDLPQAMKWEWLYGAIAIKTEQYCLGDDDLGPKYDAWLASIRRGAVRRPSDGQFFDWITQKPTLRGTDCMGPAPVSRDSE